MSKTASSNWWDLFRTGGSRRDFLRLSAGVAGVVGLGALPGCGGGRRIRFSEDPFALGVASGDPAADGVVLWTRLGLDAIRGAGAEGGGVGVEWEIAADDTFRTIVQTGSSNATPALGYSVHVEVAGLEPGRDYFYRFIAGDDSSPVGRTRTAPRPDDATAQVDFAFASCQHWEQGYYTALQHLAAEDLDFIVHLGDYIYETAAVEGRVRRHGSGEIRTLDEYRNRYAQYRSDPSLQAAHQAAPWIVTTDDHEVDNNYAGTHPNDDQSPEAFLLRRAAAYQAFYEFLPVRRSSMPSGPDMPLYRRLDFGTLLQLNVLDTRQYRDDQPCGDRFRPSCAEHVDEERSILGATQRAWLLDGLAASTSRWNVLAQQVLMARFRTFDDSGREIWSMDKWDGYPADRRRVLEAMRDSEVSNPVVLTGDIHSNWVARLLEDFDDESSATVATEFAGTSLTSGGNGLAQAPLGARALPTNPHFDFYNSQRGYVVVRVTPDTWHTSYRRVSEVEEPGGAVETLADFVVENGRAGALPA